MKLLATLLFFLTTTSFSMSYKGIKFDDSITYNGQKLIINGVGPRLATWLNIKVYAGALYIEKKSNKLEEIKNLKSPKVIDMTFMRDVDKEDLVEGFIKALKMNNFDYKKNKTQYDELFSIFPDIKEKETLRAVIETNKITFSIGKSSKVLDNFSEANEFLRLWLDKAPNDDLRDGLLGLKDFSKD